MECCLDCFYIQCSGLLIVDDNYTRKIIHVDMDAFYVSVEIRDNPDLAGKPVAVGGRSSRRGVLSTCNYLARQYGVSSAMPSAMAIKKCPDLIIVPGRMDVYQNVSKQIRNIFNRYTSVIEPLSLDEAFLDVSGSKLCNGSATLIAEQIRADIYQETGLTASAGIAPIKFLAKIASDQNKPNGQFTIAPDQVMSFIESLPLRKIPGVGKVTALKLEKQGLVNGADVRLTTELELIKKFGKFGKVLWQRCHGNDPRQIVTSRERKSVGVERTFEEDIKDEETLQNLLYSKLLPELKRRCEKHLKTRKMIKLGVKLKFADFQLTTKETKGVELDEHLFEPLLSEAFARGAGKSVRLLGVHIGLSDHKDTKHQLDLDF